MPILHKTNKQKYTTILHSITTDKNLSLKDLGLLVKLLSLPDNWEFSEKGLEKILEQDGQTSIRTAIKNLERLGYLKRTRERDENGKVRGVEWYVFEEPQLEEKSSESSVDTCDLPNCENHNLENPNWETHRQYNINKYNIKEYNIKLKKEEPLKTKIEEPKLEYVETVKEAAKLIDDVRGTPFSQADNAQACRFVRDLFDAGYTKENCMAVVTWALSNWNGEAKDNIAPHVLFNPEKFKRYLQIVVELKSKDLRAKHAEARTTRKEKDRSLETPTNYDLNIYDNDTVENYDTYLADMVKLL